jgi:hypothetical protein
MEEVAEPPICWSMRSKRSTREAGCSKDMAGFECNREDSFKFLGDLANRLTERVKDSIRSTGFGVFVDYLHYVKLDNHFSKWVISNLDLRQWSTKNRK